MKNAMSAKNLLILLKLFLLFRNYMVNFRSLAHSYKKKPENIALLCFQLKRGDPSFSHFQGALRMLKFEN